MILKEKYDIPPEVSLVFGLQMLTEVKRPPTGSEVVDTGGTFGEASAAAGAAGLLTTDMRLLLLLLLLLVVVKGDSLALGFVVPVEKILNGAAEAPDVAAGEEAPPKAKDEPNPPKLNAEPEALPAVPPLALNPEKPNVCPAVSDFGVEGVLPSVDRCWILCPQLPPVPWVWQVLV